jgi:hypothetical protein
VFEYRYVRPGTAVRGSRAMSSTNRRGDQSERGPSSTAGSSATSGRPERCDRRSRIVIRAPSGSTPGSQRSSGSSRRRRPSAASCKTTVATNTLVTLPIRNRSPARSFTCASTSASPVATATVRSSARTTARAPGTPAETTCSRPAARLVEWSDPQPPATSGARKTPGRAKARRQGTHLVSTPDQCEPQDSEGDESG